MTQKNQDFEMYAGDTKKINVTATENGSPMDLTGATIKWGIVKNSVKVVSKDLTNGISITNPLGGNFTITLNPADTSTINGNYYHEAEVTDSVGNISTIMTGVIKILKSEI